MKDFTLYLSDSFVIGQQYNTNFPKAQIIRNLDDFKSAVVHDAVFSKMKHFKRASENFEECNCIVMDVDNGDSENPNDWLSYEDMVNLIEVTTSSNVGFYAIPSRHHMKVKNTKKDGTEKGFPARDKWHFFFPIEKTTDGKWVNQLLAKLHENFPCADKRVANCSNAIFGTLPENVSLAVCHDGNETIDSYLLPEIQQHQKITLEEPKQEAQPTISVSNVLKGEPIPQGSRNAELTKIGASIIKRYGDTVQAEQLFITVNQTRCTPPLDEKELATIWKSRKKFYYKDVVSDPNYKTPAEFEKSLNIQPVDCLLPITPDDMGEARVLIRRYGNTFGMVEKTGEWLHYRGCKWDYTKLSIDYIVQKLLDDQLDEIEYRRKKCWLALSAAKEKGDNSVDEQKAEKLLKQLELYERFVTKKRTASAINAILNTAAANVPIPVSELDHDGFILNTPEGIVDLRTGKIKQHDIFQYCTHMTTVAPSEQGKEEWHSFLQTITCGNDELETYLQDICGRIAIGEVMQEGMVIAYGSGKNGKSTFFNTVAWVLGDYSCTVNSQILVEQDPNKNRFATSGLRGKRFALAAELADSTLLNDAMVKQMTSTDKVHAEKKYKDEFEFTPTHTLVLYTNYLPRVKSTDDGIWRRLIVVPFNAVIPKESIRLDFAKYIYDTSAPYILQWIIEGAMRVIKYQGKVHLPKCVSDAIEKYKLDNDWMTEFINEKCVLEHGASIAKSVLYNQYKTFTKDTSGFVRKKKEFDRVLQERMGKLGISEETDSHTKCASWRGIKVKYETSDYGQ